MGKVWLVGAGPGDPDLVTVKAARLLASADVVLHDGLVSSAILDLMPEQALRIDVAKRCGPKTLSQEDINVLMIEYARRGQTVIRLKGGDPSVFGRSGEEIEALVSAGVRFEVVPGITTALAAAAAIEKSLTARGTASSVVLATAHRSQQHVAEWNRLVTSGATLAIYMPGTNYAALAGDLTLAGLQEDTPCAVISRVSLPDQKILTTTVARLAHAEPLPAPAHVLVGPCVRTVDASEMQHLAHKLSKSKLLEGVD
jgi:uroporphyrin-III C-methyltransferase